MRKIAMLTGLMLLAACGSGEVRSTLGLNRSTPDEFKVVSRPPLSVPPEFYLRPPTPGEPALIGTSAESEASSLFLQQDDSDYGSLTKLDDIKVPDVNTAVDPVISGSLATTGEATFLNHAGADKADEDIRSKLYEDSVNPPEGTEDTSYPLQDWLGLGNDGAEVVDPKAEAERIRKNTDEDKPVNEGEVKTIDDSNKSVIDQLFE